MEQSLDFQVSDVLKKERHDLPWQHWSHHTKPVLFCNAMTPPPPCPRVVWLNSIRPLVPTPHGSLGEAVEQTLSGLADGEDEEVKALFDEDHSLRVRFFSDPTARALDPLCKLIAPDQFGGELAHAA